MFCHPDLYFNRGEVHRFMENFTLCIADMQKAGALDPSLPTSQTIVDVEKWMSRVSDLVAKKGKIKQKKLVNSCKDLSKVAMPPPHKTAGLDDLAVSSNGVSPNLDTVIPLKVIMPLGDFNIPPATFLVADKDTNVSVLSCYHLSKEFCQKMTEKDIIMVFDPVLENVTYHNEKEDETKEYKCLVVKEPKTLFVNGNPAPSWSNRKEARVSMEVK